MVVDNIADFSLNNKYREKFISIDYGVKYLGLAISDETNLISKPFLTLNETDLLSQFTKILDENNIYGLNQQDSFLLFFSFDKFYYFHKALQILNKNESINEKLIKNIQKK